MSSHPFFFKHLHLKADMPFLRCKTQHVRLQSLNLVLGSQLAVTICQWLALFSAQIFGHFTNDRIPLWMCKRYHGGIWAPELRLYCLILPLILMPVGLAIVASTLAFHYHYIVLALGVFIGAFGGLLAQPVIVNYVVEFYTHYASEATIIMAVYRLGWGIALTFIVGIWEDKVGAGWMFGMASLFSVASASLAVVLMLKGHVLRKWTPVQSLASTEAGKAVE